MTRPEIDAEIRYLFNDAQITHSARMQYLADMVEGKYVRPDEVI